MAYLQRIYEPKENTQFFLTNGTPAAISLSVTLSKLDHNIVLNLVEQAYNAGKLAGREERTAEIRQALKTLTERAKKFLARNPTLIGRVAEYEFYEHPELGDETDLKVITPDGRLKSSGFYDLPTLEEVIRCNY